MKKEDKAVTPKFYGLPKLVKVMFRLGILYLLLMLLLIVV